MDIHNIDASGAAMNAPIIDEIAAIAAKATHEEGEVALGIVAGRPAPHEDRLTAATVCRAAMMINAGTEPPPGLTENAHLVRRLVRLIAETYGVEAAYPEASGADGWMKRS